MNGTEERFYHKSEERFREDPPQPFKRRSADILEIKQGGGCLSLFGLPFLAGGIFLMSAGLGIVRFSNPEEIPAWGYLLLILFGAVFSSVGGALVFGRTWLRIDRSNESITKMKGLLTFGAGLPDDEVAYLWRLVREHISSS